MRKAKSQKHSIEYGMPPSCTHDRDRSTSSGGDRKTAEKQSEFIDIGYNMVLGRFGDWHMLACLEMQVILGQPMESGRVFQDEFEVEKYYLDQLKARIRTLAEDKARRGLGFLEGKAIVPADIWVEGKLFCISNADLDKLCASEEVAQIF